MNKLCPYLIIKLHNYFDRENIQMHKYYSVMLKNEISCWTCYILESYLDKTTL